MSIDPDLYQTATLGLLAVGVILQLAILGALSGIKKALAGRVVDSGAASGATTAGPATGQGSYYPAAGATQGATTASLGTAGVGTAATAGAGSAGTGGGLTGTTPAATGAVGAAPTGATPAAAAVPAAAAAPVATAEPQDQPFERDGRWWFRRGNELLVYDEQAAQWVPAPALAATAAAPATTAPAGVAAGAGAAPGADAGSFWKCPSCGAVNGSTSASCRMCFTPRP